MKNILIVAEMPTNAQERRSLDIIQVVGMQFARKVVFSYEQQVDPDLVIVECSKEVSFTPNGKPVVKVATKESCKNADVLYTDAYDLRTNLTNALTKFGAK